MLSASNTRKHSRTNWKRVDRLKDEEIDYSEVPQLGPEEVCRGSQAERWLVAVSSRHALRDSTENLI